MYVAGGFLKDILLNTCGGTNIGGRFGDSVYAYEYDLHCARALVLVEWIIEDRSDSNSRKEPLILKRQILTPADSQYGISLEDWAKISIP